MSLSHNFDIIVNFLNPIESNPDYFYDKSKRRFKRTTCDIILKNIIPYIDLVIDEKPHDFIYILIAWVYKTLNIPHTKIDSNEFFLLKVETEGERNKIQILSVPENRQELNTFYVYASQSSGSTWRYCEYTSDVHINKGFDYCDV